MIKFEYSEEQFSKIKEVFENELKGKLLLHNDGTLMRIIDWVIEKDAKTITKGLFKKKTFVEDSFWIKRIYFLTENTPDECLSYWDVENSGLVGLNCSSDGIEALHKARIRYLTFKKSLKYFGGQVIEIPKM